MFQITYIKHTSTNFKTQSVDFLGIKMVPVIFRQIMDTMLSGLDFSVAYQDDILLKSENPEEHKKNIFELLRRIQNYSFKLKEGK